MARRLLSLTATVAATIVICSAQTCYYPRGDVATEDVPCSTDSGFSACCGKGSICLDNSLCMQIKQPYVITRGSCTDASWKDPACPRYCQDFARDSGCSIILKYHDGTKNLSEYCCNSMEVNGSDLQCLRGGPPFVIPDANVIPGVALLASFSNGTSSDAIDVDPKTDTKTDSDSDSDPTKTATSSTTNAAPVATVMETSSRASNGNCAVATTEASVAVAGPSPTIVGAGVGAPLGVVAITAIAWALWERFKRKKLLATSSPTELASSPVMKAPPSYQDPYQSQHYQTQSFYSQPQPQVPPQVQTQQPQRMATTTSELYNSPVSGASPLSYRSPFDQPVEIHSGPHKEYAELK